MTRTGQHLLNLELLEQRHMLTVATPVAAAADESAQDPIIFQSIQLQVGDRDIELTKRNDVVIFKPGEEISIKGIEYAASPDAGGLDGVIAFEGFVRTRTNDDSIGAFDYEDGRFGDPNTQDPIESGIYEHQGLDGSWTLEESDNRISLALVRYFDDQWETHDRFFVNLQAGETDLILRNAVYKKPSSGAFQFGVLIQNRGESQHSSYVELDIYHADDLSTPVWVGVIEFTLEGGRSTFARYAAQGENGERDEVWRPESRGNYVLKMTMDPEDAVAETREDNNQLVYSFRV